jgi:ATP-binding cassette, subfamily B, bacterial
MIPALPEPEVRRPRGVLARLAGRWRRAAARWGAFLTVTRRFTPTLARRRGRLTLALVFAVAVTMFGLLAPWPLKLIIDNVVLDHAPPALLDPLVAFAGGDRAVLLYPLAAAIVVIALIGGLFYYYQRVLASRLGVEVAAELRLELYRHIQRLSFSFHDRRRTGDLLVRLTSDIRILRQALVSIPIDLVQQLLLMAGMTGVMLAMDWQLTLVALVLLPSVALLVQKYRRPMQHAIKEQREHEGQLATMATEALGAIRVVQGYRREDDEVRRFGSANRQDMRSGAKVARYEAKLRWSTDVAVGLVTAILIVLAARRVLSGVLLPGTLIVFVAYLRTFARPLRQISKSTERVARAAAAGQRVWEILSTEPDVHDRPAATPAPPLAGEIVFDSVTFAYGRHKPVITDFSLRIAAGERIAIVGPTGAGKSSIVSLIPRFYDPVRGRVLIDGRDIRDYTFDSLRGHISIVFQEPVLFATSIAENIAYGKPGATLEEIAKAARKARIDGLISRLRNGYDTVIGERGGRLSGGQRQSVAIARAMIRKTPIVILDEPTVGLDGKAADRVTKGLDRLMRGRTVVMISHDLKAVRNVDRVVVMEHGRIVDIDTPGALAARKGFFGAVSRLQAVR